MLFMHAWSKKKNTKTAALIRQPSESWSQQTSQRISQSSDSSDGAS